MFVERLIASPGAFLTFVTVADSALRRSRELLHWPCHVKVEVPASHLLTVRAGKPSLMVECPIDGNGSTAVPQCLSGQPGGRAVPDRNRANVGRAKVG